MKTYRQGLIQPLPHHEYPYLTSSIHIFKMRIYIFGGNNNEQKIP